jgi:hypothetical protein
MSQPIVFISRSRIVGDEAGFAAAFARIVPFIESTKPRTALFAAYADEARGEVRIVHVFPDQAALADHFEGSDERSASVADVIELAGFELFGPAPDAAVEQLRREAAAGGFTFDWWPVSFGGFARAPA